MTRSLSQITSLISARVYKTTIYQAFYLTWITSKSRTLSVARQSIARNTSTIEYSKTYLKTRNRNKYNYNSVQGQVSSSWSRVKLNSLKMTRKNRCTRDSYMGKTRIMRSQLSNLNEGSSMKIHALQISRIAKRWLLARFKNKTIIRLTTTASLGRPTSLVSKCKLIGFKKQV